MRGDNTTNQSSQHTSHVDPGGKVGTFAECRTLDGFKFGKCLAELTVKLVPFLVDVPFGSVVVKP